MFLFLHVTYSCIFHAYAPLFIFILILICVGAFLRVSFSLSFFWLVALWHLNISLLHLGTPFISGHLLLILPLLTFGFMMRKPVWTSQRTFLIKAFVSECQVILSDFSDTNLPTVIYNRG